MKGALTVVLFRLFTIGVFAEEKERLSVKEGDSVTLMSKFKLLTDDKIKWMFSEIQIAKISSDTSESFRERLQLDKQTGDLTISNIKATDDGEYKLKISSPKGSPPDMTFTVTVVSDTEVKPVPVTVMKGDSVTLRADLTGIQGYREIRWRFGEQTFPGSSLNITDITTQHTGLYEADITSSSSRYIIHKTFNVTISGKDDVKLVSKKKGESVNLQIDTKIQTYELIQWIFGNNIIVQMNKTSKQLFKGPDKTFRDRLKLDHQTGSLTITDTRITDSGHYKWSCKSSRYIIDRTINVYVAVPGPEPGLPPAAVAGIVVLVVLLVAVTVAVAVGFSTGVIVYKKSGQSLQSEENGGNHKKQDTEEEIKLSDDS